MRFTFIETHRAEFTVVTMCRVLEVSKAGYYVWRGRPQSARVLANEQLVLVMRDVHAESDRTYGSPRMQVELAALGHSCSENRVARIMRADGLRPKRARQFRVTTDSSHAAPIAPNALAREFAVTTIPRSNHVWSSDITYIATREGWLYLAIVLDLRSRRVVGWAMRHTLEWELARDALVMALGQRQPAAGLVHHSDRGVQGGFNSSSQHLMSEVPDVKDRQAQIESFDTKQIAVTWSAACIGQGGAAALLGGDCTWADE